MEQACTEEMFLSDVKNHTVEILKDDGVYRHVKFSNNGSSVYRFDLHTWPGELCITGDCGTYVFRRIYDMFEFFRTDNSNNRLNINPDYWGEKLLSIGTNAGYEEFSAETFIKCVKEEIDNFFDDEEDDTLKKECWALVNDELMYCEYEFEYYQSINMFSDDRFPGLFDEFWEYNTKEYTFSYLWCLYAIVWGIDQYDKVKATPST